MSTASGATAPEPRRLARRPDRALVGGVCAGFADQFGVSVLVVRTVFVLVGAWRLVGVLAYFCLWLAIPPLTEARAAPGSEAATRQGMRTQLEVGEGRDLGQAVPLMLLAAGLLWTVQALGWGLPDWWLVAGLSAAVGLGLIWIIADRNPTTREAWGEGWARRFTPLLSRWSTVLGLLVGLCALALAVIASSLALPDVGPFWGLVVLGALALGALVLAVAPWLLRTRRALSAARDARLVSDARADMAAHLHDSVLQTLALIQRHAADAPEVVRLARRQERQLRTWLYGEETAAAMLRDALREAAQAVEDDFPVQVECVTVGDATLTPELSELVKAAREAMVNAAKHSGADLVDVYAEVGEDGVEVFVRDRGRGFDPDVIAEDRMGVRGSILDRMARHSGAARIRSGPGQGTEVSLEMKR
ncbi:MAG: PspC domain-containing protein [Propioniciclava sp.]